MKMKNFKKNFLLLIFFVSFLFLIVYPVFSLFINLDFLGIKKTFFDIYFWHSFKNTIIAALLAALLGLILAIGFGYCYLFYRDTIIYKLSNLMNDLPIAIPHTVAGLALLVAFGRKNFGFIGETGLAFTIFAVILAMFFVSYPLAARSIASALDKIDKEIIDVARTLGDSPLKVYFRIVLPNLKEALFSAIVLAFSRSLSEFAAVVMFGGNLPGKTQVLASYVFTKVEEGELEMAITASVFCIILSFSIVTLLSLRKKDA